MIQLFHAVPIITPAVQSPVPLSAINVQYPADVAAELQNDLEWVIVAQFN